MGIANPYHRENCLCPVCRRGRGEITRTKQHFSVTLNIVILKNLRERCKIKGVTLTEAIEEAVDNWIADDDEHYTDEELCSIEKGREQVRRGETEPLEKVAQELGYYDKKRKKR